MAQKPVDALRIDAAVVDLFQVDANPGADDDLQERKVLQQRNRTSRMRGAWTGMAPRRRRVAARRRRGARPHAGIETAGERGEIAPFDPEVRTFVSPLRLDDDGAGAVRQRPADEIRLDGEP